MVLGREGWMSELEHDPHAVDGAAHDVHETHDTHATHDGHEAVALGPIDWPAWGLAVLGGAVALLVAWTLMLAGGA
jgi:hypothetical protein